jgi:hypothetical protein
MFTLPFIAIAGITLVSFRVNHLVATPAAAAALGSVYKVGVVELWQYMSWRACGDVSTCWVCLAARPRDSVSTVLAPQAQHRAAGRLPHRVDARGGGASIARHRAQGAGSMSCKAKR